MGLDKKKIFEMLKKNINIGGLAADILDEVLEPALQKVVDDTTNKLDDALMATIYPILEAEIKKQVEKLVNKLFESNNEKTDEVKTDA